MTKDHMDEAPPPPSCEPEAGPPSESENPEEEQAPVHWAARLRSFVDEAATIAREDLANKEITFEDTVERAEKLVGKQPLAAIGIAAGMGLLAGILINRRRLGQSPHRRALTSSSLPHWDAYGDLLSRASSIASICSPLS